MASGLCRDCWRFRRGRHQTGWGECEAPEVKRALYQSPACPLAVRADFGCRYFATRPPRPAPPSPALAEDVRDAEAGAVRW